MDIKTTNINRTNEISETKSTPVGNSKISTSFADELKDGSSRENKTETKEVKAEKEKGNFAETELELNTTNKSSINKNQKDLDNALSKLNSMVKEFNQTEDNSDSSFKNNNPYTDNNDVINNDFNIQDNKDIMPQMNLNMSFSGNGQPFASFMNDDNEKNKKLNSSIQELAEESAILSTMAENIAIANKNKILNNTHNVSNEDGIKKVDSHTGIKIENIVKFDSIIMNQADVEIFANLVENGEMTLENITSKDATKSIQISKTLAEMLVKSKENNQPLRIDFDNNISVIIRISRDGKISADFLPSSQIAEAYLKENLPLLRQRFDENNIEYDSLNQKERKNPEKENNKKKGRNNE